MKQLLGLLALTLAASVWAGDAGCGLGSLVMAKNSKVSQVLAITTNGTFSSQLLGVISGTSGCSASSWVSHKVEALKYAEANFDSLKMDISRGQGESLQTVATLLGCNSTAAQEFSKLSQEKFLEIVPENSQPVQVIDSLDQMIQNQPSLKSTCQVSA